MMLRLAFGVAMQLKPEILIVDELLAVGDAGFQAKCLKRIEEMLSAGASLLFVSHAPNMVAQFCKSAVWLDQGRVMRYGSANEVVNAYLEFCNIAPVPVEQPTKIASRSRKVAR
jgi:lipopolysaccharide transport system ATP-binding protein